MPTAYDVDDMAKRCRNWNRWGEEDEFGTLNHATRERVVEAAREVQTGHAVSLAIEFGSSGPQITGQGGRFNPIHSMLSCGTDAFASHMPNHYADDVVTLCVHGATHWDGLGHVFYQGRMWNGHDMRLVTLKGPQKNSIVSVRDRLKGRGVLLDIPRSKGKDALDDGEIISPDDLQACIESEKVELRSGDFLLVRTGQMGRCLKDGWGRYAGGDAPGLSLETALWLNENAAAAVATDTWGAEVRPNEVPGMLQPWHRLVIPNMGLTVGEMFNLEELAQACAASRRYTFFLTAPPLPIEGGTGSPVNPVAIF